MIVYSITIAVAPYIYAVLLASSLADPFSVVEFSSASPAPPWPHTAPTSSTLASLASPMPLYSLASYVQEWVATGPVVRLDWLLVRVNKDCPVAIHQLSDPECPTPCSLQPELANHISSVMHTCAVRSLGSSICES